MQPFTNLATQLFRHRKAASKLEKIRRAGGYGLLISIVILIFLIPDFCRLRLRTRL